MFERFTDRARRVIVLAQEEARLLDHGYIGTEHLLLGVLHESQGSTVSALGSVISLEECRSRVVEQAGPGPVAASGHIPFTSEAKTALEMSLRQALDLKHSYITAEHVLLGIISSDDDSGARLLAGSVDSLDSLRQAVIKNLRQSPHLEVGLGEAQYQPMGGPYCPHPENALRWDRVELPGIGLPRPVIVVRCGGCGTAVGVLPDSDADTG